MKKKEEERRWNRVGEDKGQEWKEGGEGKGRKMRSIFRPLLLSFLYLSLLITPRLSLLTFLISLLFFFFFDLVRRNA